MTTLKQYFEAANPVTGEAHADYCDRKGIGFQEVLREYHASGMAWDQPGNIAPDRLLEAFEAQSPSMSWAEYADLTGLGIRTFMKTCERLGLDRTGAEKDAAGIALAARWMVDPASVPWWYQPERAQPQQATQQWWKKSEAVKPVPAIGPGPA